MLDKLKKLVGNLAGTVLICLFFLAGWIAIAWLYPDEWFSELPRFFLSLLGLGR